MKPTSIVGAALLASAALAFVANDALAEPPSPCVTAAAGCKGGKGSHLKEQLNPQPLPPGAHSGGGGGGQITPAVKINPTVNINPDVNIGHH
jgi:hypothetical protein